MQFSTEITVGGEIAILANEEVLRETKAWRKANSVFCPLGPANSEAWILLTKASLDALANPLTADLTIVWKMVCLPPDQAKSTTMTMAGWRLAEAERIFTGGPADTAGLYLCKFVDARFRANNDNSGELRANIRTYANTENYLTGTTDYTWAGLSQELWEDCGVLGAWPGLPAGLPVDGVPENFFLVGLNSWRALCGVLDLLDCAVRHNPLTNTYTIVQLGGAQVLAANTPRLKYNGEPLRSNIDCAATVSVNFFYHRKAYGQERDTELNNNWAYNGASDTIDLATGITGANGTKVLWDDQPWILDEDSTHTNNADNTTRADNRKDRYVTRYTVAPAHKIFSGLIGNDYLPGGQVRAVLWRNWGDPDNPFGGTVTEYVSGPRLITGFGSSGGMGDYTWLDKDLVQPEREGLAPPDYGRHSYPNYPRLPNIVQIHTGVAQAGDEVAPNADGFHLGRVRRWVDNAMDTLDNCWIRFVDDHDTLAGQVNGIEDQFYYGRLSGVSTSDGDLLPVYLVKKGADVVKPVRFRLTGTLSNGGSTTANLLTFDGVAYNAGAATVYVFDWWAIATGISTRGMFQGVSGMEGWAVKREVASVAGHEEYDIIWMEQYAWDCEVTLTANPTFSGGTYTSSWTATADVDASFHQGVSPGASITVHDDQVMFPFAKSGAKAKVIRTEYEASAPYYKIVQCQQVALTGKATLSGAMCGVASADIVDFVVTSPSPFNLNVSPTIANNPRGHAGEHGNEVWLAWNTVAAAYEIIDMELRGIGVIVGLRQQDDILQGNYRTIYVERCGVTDYWLDIMPMHNFNWWCSGNYYQYCSGASVSGSGSGSGVTGATCDCTTLPSTLTLTFHGGPACLFGQSVTLTKSGSTWSWSGTIAGDSWAFDWECFATATGEIGGTLTVTYPACIQSGSPASPAALSALGGSSCDPPHIEFDAIYFSGMSGCSTCPDSSMGGSLLFAITA